jgi:hypothetical protein
LKVFFNFNQDDVYVLEQQLFRKQREITFAQEQLKEMTSLSHNVKIFSPLIYLELSFLGCS